MKTQTKRCFEGVIWQKKLFYCLFDFIRHLQMLSRICHFLDEECREVMGWLEEHEGR